MILKYLYDKKLAQAAYLVGCAETGEALVIDPARDVRPYLQAAADEGLKITHVTETHIHADFVSGVRELAAQTGARLYLSDMGGADWKYAYTDDQTVLLRDGDSWMVGNVRVEVLHTPGHTPEHVCFQITDTRGADQPIGLFTGDCLFVGSVGRPDLLETAAGIAGTKEIGARQQFHNIQRLKSLPDYLQVWPGHGAGSACGKGLGAIPSSTLGYEKLFNPAFQIHDEAEFVTWLLDNQPETPRYFGQMKRVNKAGPPPLSSLNDPVPMTDSANLAYLVEETVVIDTRRAANYARGHSLGTLNIPAYENSFTSWAGWYVDYDAPTYLIADETALPQILTDLRAIGVDNIPGYFTPEIVAEARHSIPQISPHEAHELLKKGGSYLLDVRNADEYADEHIPGAHHMQMGRVPERYAELPADMRIIVQCGGGVRSQVVASLLEREGFSNVVNLAGGIDAWRRDGLPVE
jgi:hydroxyacylglutathione hydrolase